ncbi:MAG: FtsX-like permease family protein [Candidatus Thermoplasmatota archaeon]|nr:FtsX-like permease family protein [Candidatus Thermoplasmatota archaeon]
MSILLTKRLARSLWRTKLRLSAVILMVAIGVFAGISFGTYAHSVTTLYDDIYADDESGVNLPDVWVENNQGNWNGTTAENLCQEIREEWPSDELVLDKCEPRLVSNGQFFSESADIGMVAAVWHGIDEGEVDRVWIPEHDCCSGRTATSSDEIVIDQHAAEALGIEVGDSVHISAGAGFALDYTVVGIGFHSNHLYFAMEGELLPAQPGTFVTGYMTSEGLETLANFSDGESNLLLIDVEGTPDSQNANASGLIALVEGISTIASENDNSAMGVYDRTGVTSVEFLRADADGAAKSYPVITGMLAIVAGITIFLSLQRLIQSQAKEIAVLRTLGVKRMSIMPGYILAPIFIGIIGCVIGVILGVFIGAPAMTKVYEGIIGIPIIDPALPSSLVVEVVVTAMLIVFLSGLRPAWQASRMQPLEVLRGQHEIRVSSRGLQKLTAKLPATVGLTIRSSVRKPVRLMFTFLAVGLSMLIFGSMMIMMDSFSEIFLGGLEDRQDWDVQAATMGNEDAIVEWAEEKEAEHEFMIIFPATPEGDIRQLTVYGLENVATEAGDSMYLVSHSRGDLPSANQTIPEVLIDEGLNHFLGWEIGETHSIVFGTKIVEIKITGFTQGDISRTVYFHRADLAEILDIEATVVMLQLPDGVEPDDQLAQSSLGITMREDTLEAFATLEEQQEGIFLSIQGLGILIAVAVLFNTLVMNLAERDTELATLRVLGASNNRLGLMLFGEHLGIGLIGGILGCIFSVLGTKLMLGSFVTWTAYFTVAASNSSIFTLIGIVVFISISLTPFGMWRIKKMDLVEKVKDLSQ